MTIQSKELLSQLNEAHRTIGLRDARIEHLDAENLALRMQLADAQRARSIGQAYVSENAVRALVSAIDGKRKIDAIKAVRELTGLGLKEAKDLVEQCCPAATCS